MPPGRAETIWRSAGWARRAKSGISPMRVFRASPTASRTCSGRSASSRVIASTSSPAAFPELYVAALGTLKNRSVFCPLFSAFGPEPIRARLTIGQARVLVTTRVALPAQGRAAARRAARPRARPARRRRPASRRGCPARSDYHALMAEAERPLRDRADRSRGHGAPALHQRHDRQAQGRGPRARGGRRPSHHREARPRPAPGRHLLVHGRSRLGDRAPPTASSRR